MAEEKPKSSSAGPGNLNPRLAARLQRSKLPTAGELADGILRGDRIMLSRAITLIESKQARHNELARDVIERCLPHSGYSIRLAITGSPGAGKSTFIEALGQHLITSGRQVAVLAVDPSSQVSGGSILGDKTRMEKLGQQEGAFVRPSPAGSSLGGVARKTRETIILCEAAGFNTVLIETVGVGQSEVAVHSMVDFFLLLLLPGAGDELQGIKRGIVEMADAIVVNKADGDRETLAKQAQQEYRNALHLLPARESGWTPRVERCSALQGAGIPDIWTLVESYWNATQKSGYFARKRREQATYWLEQTIRNQLEDMFYQDPTIRERLPALRASVQAEQRSPFRVAEKLIQTFREGKKEV